MEEGGFTVGLDDIDENIEEDEDTESEEDTNDEEALPLSTPSTSMMELQPQPQQSSRTTLPPTPVVFNRAARNGKRKL